MLLPPCQPPSSSSSSRVGPPPLWSRHQCCPLAATAWGADQPRLPSRRTCPCPSHPLTHDLGEPAGVCIQCVLMARVAFTQRSSASMLRVGMHSKHPTKPAKVPGPHRALHGPACCSAAAFRRPYCGPQGRRQALLSFVSEGGGTCYALAPPPPPADSADGADGGAEPPCGGPTWPCGQLLIPRRLQHRQGLRRRSLLPLSPAPQACGSPPQRVACASGSSLQAAALPPCLPAPILLLLAHHRSAMCTHTWAPWASTHAPFVWSTTATTTAT